MKKVIEISIGFGTCSDFEMWKKQKKLFPFFYKENFMNSSYVTQTICMWNIISELQIAGKT